MDIEVELDDEVVAALIEDGMVIHAFPDVLVMTDKGNKWLRDYCERELEEHAKLQR